MSRLPLVNTIDYDEYAELGYQPGDGSSLSVLRPVTTSTSCLPYSRCQGPRECSRQFAGADLPAL